MHVCIFLRDEPQGKPRWKQKAPTQPNVNMRLFLPSIHISHRLLHPITGNKNPSSERRREYGEKKGEVVKIDGRYDY